MRQVAENIAACQAAASFVRERLGRWWGALTV